MGNLSLLVLALPIIALITLGKIWLNILYGGELNHPTRQDCEGNDDIDDEYYVEEDNDDRDGDFHDKDDIDQEGCEEEGGGGDDHYRDEVNDDNNDDDDVHNDDNIDQEGCEEEGGGPTNSNWVRISKVIVVIFVIVIFFIVIFLIAVFVIVTNILIDIIIIIAIINSVWISKGPQLVSSLLSPSWSSSHGQHVSTQVGH